MKWLVVLEKDFLNSFFFFFAIIKSQLGEFLLVLLGRMNLCALFCIICNVLQISCHVKVLSEKL